MNNNTRIIKKITWDHVTETKRLDGKKVLTCMHCGMFAKSGGINKMKQHLDRKKR